MTGKLARMENLNAAAEALLAAARLARAAVSVTRCGGVLTVRIVSDRSE